jgi:hypothetical protein
MNRKIGLVALVCLVFSAQAFAECKDMDKLKDAVKRGWTRAENAQASAEPVFVRTTSTGKDEWSVQSVFNDECMGEAIIYTKKGTCDVESVLGTQSEGACG